MTGSIREAKALSKISSFSFQQESHFGPSFQENIICCETEGCSLCVLVCFKSPCCTPDCSVTWVPIPSRFVRARLGQLATLSLSSGLGAIVPELA